MSNLIYSETDMINFEYSILKIVANLNIVTETSERRDVTTGTSQISDETWTESCWREFVFSSRELWSAELSLDRAFERGRRITRDRWFTHFRIGLCVLSFITLRE